MTTPSMAREALTSADAVLARVRARIGEPTPVVKRDTAEAMRIADEWDRYVMALSAKSARASRRRRRRPSVTERLMEQAKGGPAGAAA